MCFFLWVVVFQGRSEKTETVVVQFAIVRGRIVMTVVCWRWDVCVVGVQAWSETDAF